MTLKRGSQSTSKRRLSASLWQQFIGEENQIFKGDCETCQSAMLCRKSCFGHERVKGLEFSYDEIQWGCSKSSRPRSGNYRHPPRCADSTRMSSSGHGNVPIVVLVHASENESAPRNYAFQRLLSAQGVGVFVYDKRGTLHANLQGRKPVRSKVPNRPHQLRNGAPVCRILARSIESNQRVR